MNSNPLRNGQDTDHVFLFVDRSADKTARTLQKLLVKLAKCRIFYDDEEKTRRIFGYFYAHCRGTEFRDDISWSILLQF